MAEALKFSLFADFHYKKGMYAVTYDDLAKILKKAEKEQVEAKYVLLKEEKEETERMFASLKAEIAQLKKIRKGLLSVYSGFPNSQHIDVRAVKNKNFHLCLPIQSSQYSVDSGFCCTVIADRKVRKRLIKRFANSKHLIQ